MITLKKTLLLALCGAALAAFPIANAKWHYPIHPGDHVFDAKRFADSVKETAEMVKNVQNSYEKLRYTTFFNLAADLTNFESSYNKAAKGIDEITNGNTLININNSYKNTEAYKYITVNSAMQDQGEINRILRNEANERKQTELQVMSKALKNTDERDSAIKDIITQDDKGVLAEKQKANAVAILQSVNDIDAIRMRSAMFVDELQSQEESFAAERLEEQKLKKAVFKGYDPFNPTDEQKTEMAKTSKDLGFMKIGK